VRRSLSQLGLTFFGLTLEVAPQFRLNLFKQIHDIIFHGKGGYDWHTIYNMPIWLRKFTFKEIKAFYENEKKQMENAKNSNKQTLVGTDGKVNIPPYQNSKAKPNTSYK
jgi:hypothetical protein